MASTAIMVGLGIATLGYLGRFVSRYGKSASEMLNKQIDALSSSSGKYYKGGFEQKMTKREACLILGISPTASKTQIKESCAKILALNHPDRGGSKYIASKISDARALLEKQPR